VKPAASAIDGVSITGNGGFPNPFFGTSAAAPHAAGIAALILSCNPVLLHGEGGDNPSGDRTVLREALQNTAVDLGTAGLDNTHGYGRLDADAAAAAAGCIASTPTPTPTATFTATPTVTPTPCGGADDLDGDGVCDSLDNCPGVPNADQTNTDREIRPNGPNLIGDDHTWPMHDDMGDACDDDDDNDGIPDADELTGAMCNGIVTDPLKLDTDGDNVADLFECINGSDPTDPGSVFTGSGPGEGTDSDGDRVPDIWEVRGYNASGSSTDSDGDGCADLVEIASVDDDRLIDIVDRLAVARRQLGIWAPDPVQDYALDINKNGFVDLADRVFVARAQLLTDWQPKIC
jgi:hypothetical protein